MICVIHVRTKVCVYVMDNVHANWHNMWHSLNILDIKWNSTFDYVHFRYNLIIGAQTLVTKNMWTKMPSKAKSINCVLYIRIHPRTKDKNMRTKKLLIQAFTPLGAVSIYLHWSWDQIENIFLSKLVISVYYASTYYKYVPKSDYFVCTSHHLYSH